MELNCNQLFCVVTLPITRVAFGTRSFVNHIYIRIYFKMLFWRLDVYRLSNRRVANGKNVGNRKQMAVGGSHKHLLSD